MVESEMTRPLLTIATALMLVAGAAGPAAAIGVDDTTAEQAGTTVSDTDQGVLFTVDDNETTNETTNETDDGPFGQTVSSFVHTLLADRNSTNQTDANETDQPLGLLVSAFVTENNPGADNKPSWAGPPEDRGPPARDDGNETDDNETDGGPPEWAGANDANETDDDRRGPPEDRGNDDDDSGGPPANPGNGGGNGGGPR